MKKLFDETHAHGESDARRTIWYRFDETDGLFLSQTDSPTNTAAAFSSAAMRKPFAQKVDEDTIGGQVRFTLLLRQKNNRFDCSVNLRGFVFVSAYGMVAQIREATLKRLNG